MTKKSLNKIGRNQVGQTVEYTRPDSDAARRNGPRAPYEWLEDTGTITLIRLCESGALITIHCAGGLDVLAHVHLGIYQGKCNATSGSCTTLRIIREPAQQMEMNVFSKPKNIEEN